MERIPGITGNLDRTLELYKKGLRLVPLYGKQAYTRGWQHLHLGEADIVRLFSRSDLNLGIITGELIVLDTDSDEAEAWVRAKGIESPVMVRSGGGGLHRYFVTPQDVEIRSRIGLSRIHGLDVKGWHSYIVAAGSVHPDTGKEYAYLPGKELGELSDLPFFPTEILEPVIRSESQLERKSYPSGRSSLGGQIRDVRSYIRGIASIEGQGGDKACFTVACLLAEAGFSFDEALAEMEAWNEVSAFPAWSREALVHKLRYAFERVMSKPK
jgi:hypothetical protein